jgi:hypothetical protein
MKVLTNYLDTPLPEKTKSYTPVGHKQLIELVEERLDVAGFERSTLDVDQNGDGTIIIANMGIKRKENDVFSQQFSTVNSYNKTKPVTFASGGRVFVCQNGMIISESVVVRKHTANVWEELEQKADVAIKQLETNWERMVVDYTKMKEVEMTFTQQSEILGRIFVEQQILQPTEVTVAAKELRDPTFEDFSALTLWSLYNACTYALRQCHPFHKNVRLKQLHDFCLELV